MSNIRRRVIILMVLTTAAVCLAVLFRVQIYAAYAIRNTPIVTVKTIELRSRRGRIFDRRGILLAGTDRDGNRFYPENTAVHLLGTLSSSGEAQSGIELALDSELAGTDGVLTLEYTTYQGETYLSDRQEIPAKNGCDVFLTIDSALQKRAEKILSDAMEQYEQGVDYDTTAPPAGSAGAIVACDPKTGEILAMASAPDHPLEDFSQHYDEIAALPNSPLLNRATQGLYRPGSVFKTVTAIAALSEGVINDRSGFFCSGQLWVGDTRFSCMNSHGYTDVTRALSVSCNVFFYRTSRLMGIEPINRYGGLFGLGEAPELQLPALAGQLTEPEQFSEGEFTDGQLVQAAIGQAKTQCTPLQLAILASAIANRGERFKPSAVLKITDADGKTVYLHRKSSAAVIKDKNRAFEICIEGMISSTAFTYGDFALSALPESVALKTGTPQSSRGYDSAAIGFYPAYDPEIAFSIMLEGGANAKHAVRYLLAG